MRSSFLVSYPLFVPVLGLGFGIYSASRWETWARAEVFWLSLGLASLSLGLFLIVSGFNSRICWILFFLCLGSLRLGDHFFRPPPAPIQAWIQEKRPVALKIQALEYPQAHDRSIRFKAKLLGWQEGEKFHPLPLVLQATVLDKNEEVFPGKIFRGLAKFRATHRFQNPSSFDYARYLRAQGVWGSALFENKLEPVAEETNGERVWGLAYRLRRHILDELDLNLDGKETRGVMKALLVGDESELPSEISEAFRRTGLTHVLVVSGLHLTLLFLVFFLPIYALFFAIPSWSQNALAKRSAMGFALLPLVVYSMLVGFSPSVLRSLATVSLGVLVLLLKRRPDFLSFLLLTLFLLLLAQPTMLFDLSFQLSFLSVATLYFFGKSLAKVWQILPERPRFWKKAWVQSLATLLLSSVAVNLALAPLLVNSFHEISWISPLTNLVFVPLFSFLFLPGGLVATALGWISPLWGHWGFKGLEILLHYSLEILSWVAAFPGITLRWPQIVGWKLFAYAIFLAEIFCLARPRRALGIALLSLLVFLLSPPNKEIWWQPGFLNLTMLDVGQGDALLLTLPEGENLLIDGGGIPFSDFDIGKNILMPELLSRGIRSLRSIALTHPDADHWKGLYYFAQNWRLQNFWLAKNFLAQADFQKLHRALQKRGIPIEPLSRGLKWELGGAKIEVLNPPLELSSLTKDNDQSLVLRVCLKEVCFLLTGDIEKAAEEEMAKEGTKNFSFLLKVPHHGSRTSSSQGFLQSVQPRLALISDGLDNRFGFPSSEVLERLGRSGAFILRTDLDGQIEVKTDGRRLYFRTYSGREGYWIIGLPGGPIPSWWFASRAEVSG